MKTNLNKLRKINERIEDILTDEELIDAINDEGIETIEDILINEGIKSIEDLALQSKAEIIAIFRHYQIPGSKGLYYLEQAENYMNKVCGFQMGDELLQKYEAEKQRTLKTGCNSFDKILEGGFVPKKTYALYGDGTISILINTLICISNLSEEQGGLDSQVTIYLDTNDSFQKDAVEKVALKLGMDAAGILEKLKLYKFKNTRALTYFCSRKLLEEMKTTNASLIILNDLPSLFRSEYGSDMNRLPERQARAVQVVKSIRSAAEKHDTVAIIVNQEDFNGQSAMGLWINQELPTLIRFEPYKKKVTKIIIERSDYLPQNSCLLKKVGCLFQDMD